MEYDIKINEAGTIYYYKKGTKTYHRKDGPAIIYASGRKEWVIDGYLHRIDGPAVEDPEYYVWAINGKYHRASGPAVEMKHGYKQWWINGRRLLREKELILNKWWDNKNGI